MGYIQKPNLNGAPIRIYVLPGAATGINEVFSGRSLIRIKPTADSAFAPARRQQCRNNHKGWTL